MKGSLSTWYLILIAIGVVTMLTIGLITTNLVETLFIESLESALS